MKKWLVTTEGDRLLTFVKERCKGEFSTKDVRFAIEHGRCKVNGSFERYGSRRLKAKDVVELTVDSRPRFTWEKERVLYEDETLLIYNKPSLISSEDLSQLLGLELAHRLDRDTTGVFLLAKSKLAQTALFDLFEKRLVKKTYLALTHGHVDKVTVKNLLGKIGHQEGSITFGVHPRGKVAITHFEPLQGNGKYTYVRCIPETGRTHQIRVHLSGLGRAIVGDLHYGGRSAKTLESTRPLLHAESIEFVHPFQKMPLRVVVDPPSDFQDALLKSMLF